MTSQAQQLIDKVHEAGGNVTVSGDDLELSAPAPLPDDLVEELRQAKPALLQHFAEVRPAGYGVALAIPPGVPDDWCRGVAVLLAMPRPKAWPEALWPQLREDAFAFLRDRGARAAELDWTILDIFGACPRAPRRRFDAMGLVPILEGRAVVKINHERAVIRQYDGRNLNFTKPTTPDLCVLIWELEK